MGRRRRKEPERRGGVPGHDRPPSKEGGGGTQTARGAQSRRPWLGRGRKGRTPLSQAIRPDRGEGQKMPREVWGAGPWAKMATGILQQTASVRATNHDQVTHIT
eukprot:15333293-Alexandrium_andersonii.AAC.1